MKGGEIMKKYMVDNAELEQHFFVYAESPLGAMEKALIELKTEPIPENTSVDFLAGVLYSHGWLVYEAVNETN
jgi:hypothetical protein